MRSSLHCVSLLAAGALAFGCESTAFVSSDTEVAPTTSLSELEAAAGPGGKSGPMKGGDKAGPPKGNGGPMGPLPDPGEDTPGPDDPPPAEEPAPESPAPVLPDVPYSYAADLPAHFTVGAVDALDNTPADNPVTDAGATLGRVLFYDVNLSQDRSIPCGSCHAQDLAFGDATAFSLGFDGGLTGRNSMHLVNVAWYAPGRMFWDERAATLEEQVLMPIEDPVEMGMTLPGLVTRVFEQPYYEALFDDAFGDAEVTSDRIARALAQFVRAMVSTDSEFDAGLIATGDVRAPFPNFTAQENQGKGLFLGPGRCAVCHLENPGGGGPGGGGPGGGPGGGGPGGGGPGGGGMLANQAIFQLDSPANNGLDAGPTEADNGVGDATGNPQQNGVFKSPSLRNTGMTGPYMHDGRFDTLAEVVAFYDNGVQNHPRLDPRLRGQNGQPRRLNFSPQQRQALVAFLHTLTDEQFLMDERFADPFALP